MKKKFLSLLLVLCMLVPMLASQAYAAKDYSPYYDEVEIQEGDTVIGICAARGMDYIPVVKQAVLIANGLATADSLGAVRPGQKINIPKSEAAADAIVTLYNAVVSAVIPESYVLTYTVESGDTLFSICSSLRLTYSTCKEAILSLNGWSGEAKLNTFYAGQTFFLPRSDEYASAISETVAKAVEANTNILVNAGDTFSFYLVSHTMAAGETVRSVCESLGEEYTSEMAAMVTSINGLSDASKVKAGTSYLFPSASAVNAAYAVYSHTVASGDTAGNLCTAYGVKYAEVSGILQGLNPKTNLSAIMLGSDLLLVTPCGTGIETPVIIK